MDGSDRRKDAPTQSTGVEVRLIRLPSNRPRILLLKDAFVAAHKAPLRRRPEKSAREKPRDVKTRFGRIRWGVEARGKSCRGFRLVGGHKVLRYYRLLWETVVQDHQARGSAAAPQNFLALALSPEVDSWHSGTVQTDDPSKKYAPPGGVGSAARSFVAG